MTYSLGNVVKQKSAQSLKGWFTTALLEKDNQVKGESRITGDIISKATRHSVCEREGNVEVQKRITTSESVARLHLTEVCN